ncbi:GGDEF domain-containing protein [Pseudoduganella buxea]|uniref:diguanylate cyclase n=1 Tax=Pseudoduganella buxea TaxID=1949069 RepID=A0A6I3SV24_9BURK|nr:GGDEF domain-containing protein [Pseudoduganella buxea]MTV52894.1 diguanylate cyclase [Pseudoduganella buxea]GGC16360.1 hypothetical protein GCM10011572_42120 [Pseudoduganella buxea]
MDALTLIVASGMAATIMAAAMAMLYRASSGAAGLLDWSLAGLLFLASNIVAFGAVVSGRHEILIPAVGNALYVAGHFAIGAGLRRHLGLPPRYGVLAGIAVLVAALHWLPFAQQAVANRLMLFTPIIVAINFSVVRLLWRMPAGPARAAYMPLLCLEVLFMAQMLVRAGYLAIMPETTLTFLGSQALQTVGSLFVLLFLMVAGMSCALIVIRHQELALRKASLTDSLTGWLNRRALHDLASREFARVGRGGHALSFIAFDIDHFKAVNDRHGHSTGDIAIRHVTALAEQALRGYDALFRLGGEEFAVLVTGHGPGELHGIAERVRDLIERTPLYCGDKSIAMTVSIGLATCAPADTSWEDALRRADGALYQSKREGRNRVTPCPMVRLHAVAA